MLWRTPIAGPDPHFLLQLELESGRSKGRTDEAEAVFGRADYRHPEGGRGGCGDDGSLPEARHVEPDLLCVEGRVRWHGGIGGEAVARARGGERATQTFARGSDAGALQGREGESGEGEGGVGRGEVG